MWVKDEYGKYSFDFRGKFKPAKTKSSEIICVTHIQGNDENFSSFLLGKPCLIGVFLYIL